MVFLVPKTSHELLGRFSLKPGMNGQSRRCSWQEAKRRKYTELCPRVDWHANYRCVLFTDTIGAQAAKIYVLRGVTITRVSSNNHSSLHGTAVVEWSWLDEANWAIHALQVSRQFGETTLRMVSRGAGSPSSVKYTSNLISVQLKLRR